MDNRKFALDARLSFSMPKEIVWTRLNSTVIVPYIFLNFNGSSIVFLKMYDISSSNNFDPQRHLGPRRDLFLVKNHFWTDTVKTYEAERNNCPIKNRNLVRIITELLTGHYPFRINLTNIGLYKQTMFSKEASNASLEYNKHLTTKQ